MAQDEDRLASFDAVIETLRLRAQKGLLTRAEKLASAFNAWKTGQGEASEVRRMAHQLRGAAEDVELRELAESVECAAAEGSLPEESTMVALVARARTLSSSATGGIAAEEAATVPPVPSSRILVVDDDQAILRMVQTTLERLGGHQVIAVTGASDACAALDGDAFDIVLLDAMMPDTNGLELCVEVRAREHQRGATLVVLSAATREQLGWPDEGGPDFWWRKPLPSKSLLERVAQLLEHEPLGTPAQD